MLVGLTVTLFSEKMLISTRFIHGFMPNSIKKSVMVSTLIALMVLQLFMDFLSTKNLRKYVLHNVKKEKENMHLVYFCPFFIGRITTYKYNSYIPRYIRMEFMCLVCLPYLQFQLFLFTSKTKFPIVHTYIEWRYVRLQQNICIQKWQLFFSKQTYSSSTTIIVFFSILFFLSFSACSQLCVKNEAEDRCIG